LTLILVSFSAIGNASQELRVLNFNVMCDFCGKTDDHGKFKDRIRGIADTINRHNPDLISLQELRNGSQVERILKLVNTKYHNLYTKRFISYADPTLLLRKSRFDIKDRGHFWLGPNPRIPFGWKMTSFPRQIYWVHIFDKLRNQEFIFAGTHFDNNEANKSPSVKVSERFISTQTLPIIYAGDFNINPLDRGYTELLGSSLEDTFTEPVNIFANKPYEIHEACPRINDTFPDCRIEHVLISKNSGLKVKSWGVDLFRYIGKRGFTSDHRAVIVNLE
jgi:endonuclease/exonuclease/phosphatase family metal-dependent hydrolase